MDDTLSIELESGMIIATDNNILVFDTKAKSSGDFTKRLISLMKVVMRRNYGDHLIVLYVSPSVLENVEDWLDECDETKGTIFEDETLTSLKCFGVEIKKYDDYEQLKQIFFNEKGALPENKTEIVLGFGKTNVILGTF